MSDTRATTVADTVDDRIARVREDMPDLVENLLQPQARFGQLGESLHFAAYAYERAMQGLRGLLTDDRWRRVGAGFNDVNVFIESLSLHQFKKLTDERKELATLIKKLQPEATTRSIAKATGVDKSTITRDLAHDEPKPELGSAEKQSSLGSQSANPALTGADAAKLVAKAEKKLTAAEGTKQRREASRDARPLPDGMELRIGDSRESLGACRRGR